MKTRDHADAVRALLGLVFRGMGADPQKVEAALGTDTQTLAVMSDLTPKGHHGLLRPRDPVTHRIMGGMGRAAGAQSSGHAHRQDDVEAVNGDKAGRDRKFSSTQFNLSDATFPHGQPSPLPELVRLASEIPHTHLADKGREDHFHVTVKYGLHTDDPEEIRDIVEGTGQVTMKLGKVSLFKKREPGKEEFDVVKVDVESDKLRRLNQDLVDELAHTDTHPEYTPHLTIAYVRPGFADHLVGNAAVEGVEFTCDKLVFSDRDKKTTEIKL